MRLLIAIDIGIALVTTVIGMAEVRRQKLWMGGWVMAILAFLTQAITMAP